MPNELGRLERVDLRAAWSREATHFTPWLAQDENLALLADALGLELELQQTERPVGPFSADIVCKDLISEDVVLIENQLERTDHSHLGQLLTYAAGLEAVIIVWIAAHFTDEHRAVLDWLNEVTNERASFFGLEVELWRIGDSPPAPKFNIVSRPNEWTRRARPPEQGGATPFQEMQLDYWTELLARLVGTVHPFTRVRPPRRGWLRTSLGRSGFACSAFMNSIMQRVGVYIEVTGADAGAHFSLLHAQRQAIESEVGAELVWTEEPGRLRRGAKLYLQPVDVRDRSDWPRQHQWLIEKSEAMYKAFAPRVQALDATQFYGDTADDVGE